MPFTEIDRADITPGPARLKALQLKFHGVSHVIFDEMNMMGRRSLGQIDWLLKLATGCATQDFGALNVSLCGDHGQLPPVKDC
eukprot:597000-Pleurochrysis_carterae.AAC.1